MMILIGDPRQSIYGFRGAIDALGRFMELTCCKSLPMNISQRCSIAVCNEANTVFPDNQIVPCERAKNGSVSRMTDEGMYRKVQSGDFILCRTNLPLVKACYSLLKRKVKCFILGRDIGFGLIALLKQAIKDNNTEDLAILAMAICETAKVTNTLLTAQNKNMEASNVMDRAESLLVFFEGCTSVAMVEEKIKETFKEDGDGVCLSTVHKIKGAEAENVFILKPELMPHPKSKNAHEEACIKFVAITRSKNNLYYVTESNKQDEPSTEDHSDKEESEVLEIESKQE